MSYTRRKHSPETLKQGMEGPGQLGRSSCCYSLHCAEPGRPARRGGSRPGHSPPGPPWPSSLLGWRLHSPLQLATEVQISEEGSERWLGSPVAGWHVTPVPRTAAARAHWPSTTASRCETTPALWKAGGNACGKVHQSLENARYQSDIQNHHSRRTSIKTQNDTCLQAGTGIRTFLHCW